MKPRQITDKIRGMRPPNVTPAWSVMTPRGHAAPSSALLLVSAAIASGIGCRSSSLLDVAVPPGVTSGTELQDSAGAQALRFGALGVFAGAYAARYELILWSGLLSDEFHLVAPDSRAEARMLPEQLPVVQLSMDATYASLQKARVQAQQAITALEHLPTQPPGQVGELFAVVGYSEVLLAETMCAGVPLSGLSSSGALTYGVPLTTDSLLGVAAATFDSAAAHANGVRAIASLAAIGKGRTLLDRGQFGAAAAAVASVPPTFSYYVISTTFNFGSMYQDMAANGTETVSDRRGINGLGYVSLHDSRLQTVTFPNPVYAGDSVVYPLKFPYNPAGNDSVPLADGVEAGLIQAEGALAVHDTNGWLTALNTLRANFATLRGSYPTDTTYHQLQPLSDPGTDSARATLTFTERALWLYGTGHRLGDLRRLVRQYGRDQSAVFPIGATLAPAGGFPHVYPQYGTDVNFPIPMTERSNPDFHGCLNRGA